MLRSFLQRRQTIPQFQQITVQYPPCHLPMLSSIYSTKKFSGFLHMQLNFPKLSSMYIGVFLWVPHTKRDFPTFSTWIEEFRNMFLHMQCNLLALSIMCNAPAHTVNSYICAQISNRFCLTYVFSQITYQIYVYFEKHGIKYRYLIFSQKCMIKK